MFLDGHVDFLRERGDLALGFRQNQRLLLHSADLKKARPHLRDLWKSGENFVNGMIDLVENER